ncbi:MAG: prephenate dehydratase domain-containing protein, partial [Pseudomonadota bacterium]|nr:prephenate dehydratase domain-containing protein [Pseudomonadota bacterium]
MRQFAKPALALVDSMRAAAAADPLRAIAFGGAPGSNSHQAAMQFAPEALPLPCFSFEDALEAVESGAAGCAMIPIENSQHGRVADIHFLLPESGLCIVAEHFMRITHCLMALGKGPFEAAYSHPQALGQSHRFLGERGIVGLSHADTAGAAAFVAESGKPNVAAIAPALAADLYGLQIVEREVEDAPDNTTRFVVLAKDALDPAMLVGASAMTTFIFEVKNIP